jgi:hypothetical protein
MGKMAAGGDDEGRQVRLLCIGQKGHLPPATGAAGGVTGRCWFDAFVVYVGWLLRIRGELDEGE